MKSILILKLFFFSNEWYFSMWNSPCLLEFLDLIIIGFLAHAKSLLTQPLETRLSIPSIYSQEPSWTHIDFAIIMKTISFMFAWSSKYLIHSLWQAFQYMRLCISIHHCLMHNTLTCHFEYHILQQASFRYWSEFIIINTYPNLHDIHCLLSFSY